MYFFFSRIGGYSTLHWVYFWFSVSTRVRIFAPFTHSGCDWVYERLRHPNYFQVCWFVEFGSLYYSVKYQRKSDSRKHWIRELTDRLRGLYTCICTLTCILKELVLCWPPPNPPMQQAPIKNELKQLVDVLREKGCSYAFLLMYPNVLAKMCEYHIELVSEIALVWGPVVCTSLSLIRDRQKVTASTKVRNQQSILQETFTLSLLLS